MKKLFSRKKLKKSKSELPEKVNGTAPVADIPQSKSTIVNHVSEKCEDWEAVCSSHEAEQNRPRDVQLEKHMMQTINDVKYLVQRSKYTALSEVNFARACFEAHNDVRQKYGVQKLAWSGDLAEMAHAWAVKIAERGRILYPELAGIGENMSVREASSSEHLPTGAEVVAEWEAEAANFDFQRPRWNPKCQRFTQMVWKESSELGAARHWHQANNCVAVVCLYRPGGNNNAPGEFASNVCAREQSLSPARSLASQLKKTVVISTRENHKKST